MGESNIKTFLGISGGSRGLAGDYERNRWGREGQEARERNKQLFDKTAIRGVQSRRKLFPQEGTGEFN